jgi:site-specific DNA recombinase
MIAAMAQWEREEISERVAASVPVRAKLGKSLGGQAPFGYQWKDKRLIPDPKEAPMRVRIFELFAEHRRKKAVARLMNASGYRTRKGGKFSDTSIDRLLKDTLPKGQRRSNYAKSLGDKQRWHLKPESEWVFTDVEPIISAELWERCNRILAEQSTAGKRVGKKPVWLFAGKVSCVCGKKMYVPSGSLKFGCPECKNKIAVADLEEIFKEHLQNFLASPDDINACLGQADERIAEKEKLLESLEKERDSASKQMEKVYRAYINDELPMEAFGRHYRPLEARVREIEDEIPRTQAAIDYLKIEFHSSDQVLAEAKDLCQQWPSLTIAEKQQIIEDITDGVLVGKEEISINLSYLPTPSKKNSNRVNALGANPQKQQKGNASLSLRLRE